MERIFGKNIEGKKLEEKDLREIRDEIEDKRGLGIREIHNELDKSPRDQLIIERAATLLTDEIESLGVKTEKAINPKRIHFLNHADFLNTGHAGAKAFLDPLTGHIYVDNEGKKGLIHPSDLNEFKLLLHEFIHARSHITYYADDQRQTLDAYRTGYSSNNVSSEEDAHGHFTGLNEAVTEAMALEITLKNRATLDVSLTITGEDWYALVSPYETERKILSFIIKKVAEKNSETEEEVWERFKRSAFTGELMHLRDIERTFGQGALRVVAAIDSGTFLQEKEDIQGYVDLRGRDFLNQKILEYLETEDDELRDTIAYSLLNNREYKGVQKRRATE